MYQRIISAGAMFLTGGNAREILADMDRRFNAAFDHAVSQGVINRADYIKPEIEQQFRRR